MHKKQDDNILKEILHEYAKVPDIFHPTRYWKDYEKEILKKIKHIDFDKFRSGIYPIFGTFGFSESIYPFHARTPFYKKLWIKMIIKLFHINKILPYSLTLYDIREMAFQRCLDIGRFVNACSISNISISKFGKPKDYFQIKWKFYTMQSLSFYLRYCFAHKHINFTGKEIIVELGPGSGHQIEVLKKLYPQLTIFCFDLPTQIFICEKYLTGVFGTESIVGLEKTLKMKEIPLIEQSKIYFFCNWQITLMKKQKFDIFWNSASFGEMEPSVVKNYLSYIIGNFKYAYLLQARNGKESFKNTGVKEPIKFSDYNDMLIGYRLVEQQDAFQAHRRLSQSGGYFEGVWKKI